VGVKIRGLSKPLMRMGRRNRLAAAVGTAVAALGVRVVAVVMVCGVVAAYAAAVPARLSRLTGRAAQRNPLGPPSRSAPRPR
jgi:hypothetical protein